MKYTLLQYNIYHFKFKGLISFLKKVNPDILTLQEVTSFQQNWGERKDFDGFKLLSDKLSMKGKLSKRFFMNDKWKSYQGNAIFSRFPIISSKVHFLSGKYMSEDEFGGDWRYEPRTILEVDIQVDRGKCLKVFTTHLSYNTAFRANIFKRKENKKLLEVLDQVRKNSFILAGDFNSTSSSRLIQILGKKYHNPTPKPIPTWTLVPFSYKGFSCSELKYQLDFVFSSNGVRITKVETKNVPYSDHLPLIAEFEL